MGGYTGIPDLNDEDELRRRVAPDQPAPPGPRIAKPSAGDSGLPPATLRGISPQLQQRTDRDEARAADLSKGSGISQIHNGVGRGILRGLSALGSAVLPGPMSRIPGTELHHRVLERQNENALGEDYNQQARDLQTAAIPSEVAERNANTEHLNAETKNLQNPQPKEGTTPEEVTIHDLMTGENGQPRLNPQTNKPYTYLEAYGAVKQAAQDTKPDKTPNDKQQDITDYLAAHNLPDNPANREKAREEIAKRSRNPEQGSFMPLYDDKGQVSGAWNPRTGSVVKSPTALPGNTTQGHALATKAGETADQANAAMSSFQRYHESFKTLAPQLTEDDRRALQVLTSHEQVAHGFLDKAASGVLDTLFGAPLTGYSEKAMGGIMTKDQYDKMSPAGKKMLADYFNAVIQNFGNMKQIMGSIGRNPMQLQAEINTIPLPYVDAQSAETMFNDKFEDMKIRNHNIPNFGQSSPQAGENKNVIVVSPEDMR